MELLTSPKSEYLLQAGIRVLHAESREWLEEIAFMDDEIRFFLKLLDQLPGKAVGIQERSNYEKLKKGSKHFQDTVLRELETGIRDHERYLAELIGDGNTEDQAKYRWRHARLKSGFETVQMNFRNHKKSLFQWVARQ